MSDEPRGAGDSARIDREIRLNEAWHEADDMARRRVAEDGLTGEAAEKAVECWRDLYTYDTSPDSSEREILAAEGVELPPPEELNDEAIHVKLWEIIRAMAARNTFLHCTNHLSDRELYAYLVERSFDETRKDFAAPGWEYHLDILGSGSDEDMELYLRYYADDEYRARWARDWPKDVIPPKEKPPFDRDRLLPTGQHD